MIPILSHTQKNVLSPDYFLFFQVEHLIAVDDSYFLRKVGIYFLFPNYFHPFQQEVLCFFPYQ